jgi:hypothetical protein
VGFKVGSKVKFTYFDGADDGYFEMDKVYTIGRVEDDSFDDERAVYMEGIPDMFAWLNQLKLVVEDNAMNRMLYPEYKPVNGYLEKEDV